MSKIVKIKKIVKLSRMGIVCDLQVEGNHNLFVSAQENGNYILAHNCDKEYLIKMMAKDSIFNKALSEVKAKYKESKHAIKANYI